MRTSKSMKPEDIRLIEVYLKAGRIKKGDIIRLELKDTWDSQTVNMGSYKIKHIEANDIKIRLGGKRVLVKLEKVR